MDALLLLDDVERLRELRKKTQEDVDRLAAASDVRHAIPAQARYAARQGHHTASPAAH